MNGKKVFCVLTTAILLTLMGMAGCTLDREGVLFGDPSCPEECTDAGSDGTTEAGDACPDGCDGGTAGAGGEGGTAGTGGTGGTAGEGGMGGTGGEGGCVPTGDDVCDGVDNDCDPNTEDGSADPALGDGCNTGLDGICEAGTQECNNGALECVQDNQPAVTEDCNNSFDDDCDGNVNNGCPYTATFAGDGDNCHKIVTLDGVDAIEPSNSSPDGACIGTMLVTNIFGGYKQGVIDNDPSVTVDTDAPIDMVGAKCVVVSMGNMDNVTQSQLKAELLAPGFNPGDVVTNCNGTSCTYTKASQCNGGQFPMIGVFYSP